MKVAVIDIGTNSARLDIRELSAPFQSREILKDRAVLRLGRAVYKTGGVYKEALAALTEAAERFSTLCSQQNVERIVAVGTSALREANNRRDILKQIKQSSGISIEVITGAREAALISKGILKRERTSRDLTALVDIGGGSTELTLCRGGEIFRSQSFPIGALRMQELFLKTVPPRVSGTRNSVSQLRHHIRVALSEGIILQGWPTPERLIGSSGTVKAVSKLEKKDSDGKVSALQLRKLIETMIPLDQAGLLRIPGMEDKRTDIILSGSIILDEIMNIFRAQEITVTEYTLRDGLFDEVAETLFPGS